MRAGLCFSSLAERCDLPGQRQPPRLDPALWVIVPHGAKSDVLNRLVIREYPLDPFVELLRKCR